MNGSPRREGIKYRAIAINTKHLSTNHLLISVSINSIRRCRDDRQMSVSCFRGYIDVTRHHCSRCCSSCGIGCCGIGVADGRFVDGQAMATFFLPCRPRLRRQTAETIDAVRKIFKSSLGICQQLDSYLSS